MRQVHHYTVAGSKETTHVIVLESEDDGEEIYSVDFRVVAVVAWGSDGELLLERAAAVHSGDHVEDVDKAEAVAAGFVKWDGCTQFTMDAHEDSRRGLEGLFAAVLEARRLAAKAMVRYDSDEYEVS